MSYMLYIYSMQFFLKGKPWDLYYYTFYGMKIQVFIDVKQLAQGRRAEVSATRDSNIPLSLWEFQIANSLLLFEVHHIWRSVVVITSCDDR